MYIQSALLSVSEQMISDLVLPEYALVALTGINSEIIGSGSGGDKGSRGIAV
jgi:hypothetical protein